MGQMNRRGSIGVDEEEKRESIDYNKDARMKMIKM
jgi:hypothetical protein